MKKVTVLALTAVITLTSVVSNVQASGRLERICHAANDNTQINILYNDEIINCDGVKPVNTDGRVMIPFRTALENMGAGVEYDDAHRLVTAKKDDITIKFTLMDDTIYIDRNGAQSTITMDVPMIISDGSTLVPIRFMSNAFDMKVGWDGDSETVIIMDYDEYFKDIEKIMPNMSKLFELEQRDFNKCGAEFDIDLSYSDSYDNFAFAINGSAESGGIDSASKMNMSLDIECGNVAIKDAESDIIFDNGSLYIKTDILEQLAKNGDNKFLKFASVTFNGITWYKLDLEKINESLGLFGTTNQIINSTEQLGSYLQMITELMSAGNYVDMETAIMAASMIDAWEEMDKYITVKEKDNGGYEVKIDISPENFNKIIRIIGSSQMSEENLNKAAEMIRFACLVNVDCDGSRQTADMMIDVAADIEDIRFKLKINLNENDEISESIKTVELPAEYVDITDAVLGFMK